MCNKASQKLHALARVSGFMSQNILIMVMKTFIMLQFNYCPLVCGCLVGLVSKK